jgi:hypothetical protein
MTAENDMSGIRFVETSEPNERTPEESMPQCLSRIFDVLYENFYGALDVPHFIEDVQRLLLSPEIDIRKKENLVQDVLFGPCSDYPEHAEIFTDMIERADFANGSFYEVSSLLDIVAIAIVRWDYEDWTEDKKNPIAASLSECTKEKTLPYLIRVRVEQILNTNMEQDVVERMCGGDSPLSYVSARHTYDKVAVPFPLTQTQYGLLRDGGVWCAEKGVNKKLDDAVACMQAEYTAYMAALSYDIAYQTCVDVFMDYFLGESVASIRRCVDGFEKREECVSHCSVHMCAEEKYMRETYYAIVGDKKEVMEGALAREQDARHNMFTEHNIATSENVAAYVDEVFDAELRSEDVFPVAVGESAEAAEQAFASYRHLLLPWVREKIQADSGLNIADLTTEEQGQLFYYFATQKEDNIYAVQKYVHMYGAEGARALLVTRYGENYGHILVALGEEHKHFMREFLPHFVRIHALSASIGNRLEMYEPLHRTSEECAGLRKVAAQLQEGINRRAKDVLLVAKHVLEEGALDVPYYGNMRIGINRATEVINAMCVYERMLELSDNLLQGKDGGMQFQGKDATGAIDTYHFIDTNTVSDMRYCMVQLRERGAPFGAHDAGREFDGEARINVLMHSSPIATSLNASSRQEAVSFRLDREGKTRKDGNITENDPTRQNGEASLEIGAVFGNNQSLPGNVVGRVIAAGNYLGMAQKKGAETQYYHNRESFSPEIGDADTFATLVRIIRHALEREFASSVQGV